ncbi:hypothetical protein CPter91_3008 [Collimonas pratensis]|uniref:Uncharacterized protein n=1 Tax=Collimonas pratensis TaxID=279113 RepID=A0A127Q5L3_9BURK|nr:hypothetical protein CPter91_3008 [Collimonas pratensis]
MGGNDFIDAMRPVIRVILWAINLITQARNRILGAASYLRFLYNQMFLMDQWASTIDY